MENGLRPKLQKCKIVPMRNSHSTFVVKRSVGFCFFLSLLGRLVRSFCTLIMASCIEV